MQDFHIGDKIIPILVEDIEFLTRLSRRGSPIFLAGSSLGGETMRDYIHQHFQPGTEPIKYGKINICDVRDLPLRTILFTITKLAGSVTLHVANRSYMQYSLECLESKIFN